jgi:NADH-quinone oxidoreductase subunit L
VLSGKYYVDEAYEALIGRPLLWISDRVFLRIGDRALFDGTLHGFAALGRSAAAGLARIQNGNLHLYALLRADRDRRVHCHGLAPCLMPAS